MSQANFHNKIQIYDISEIPDVAYSRYQAAGGGNVVGAIASGFEHLLRILVQMPPGSCSVELEFMYRPAGRDQNNQERLKFYIQMEASDSETASNLESLLMGSPISCFYKFNIARKIPDSKQFYASCKIIRKMDYIEPLYPCDVNPKIPRNYCTISSFIPNENNDYMMLDRVLDRINTAVTISLKVEPVDISPQMRAHTAAMANLADINHSYTDYDESGGIDYTNSGGHSNLRPQSQVKPLNRKDPLASDVLQAERQIHKTLLKPHLSFSFEIKAETKSAALLVASTVAEEAFKGGSYRIVNGKAETPAEGSGETCRQKTNASVCSSEKHVDGNTEPEEYKQLKPLIRRCPVEELSGIIGLPIASSSPLCCRKNTDPSHIDEKNLIVLGHKEQSLTGGGRPIPLGISIDELVKHLAVYGLSGSGKTTSNMGILYQLNARDIRFMVIECRKREYRVMKMLKKHKNPNVRRLAKKLRFYSPGAEHISPFQFNPLKVPHGITIAEHIEKLKSDFKASIPISVGSLPAILGEALEKIYEDYPDPDRPPVMTDLIAAIEVVLAAKGYSAETRSDMQTAIEVRLGILAQGAIGKIFQSRHGISIEQIMEGPSLFELEILQRQEACLFVLSIFSQIWEYLRTSPPPAEGLRYVIMIEEAHLIFGSNNGASASEEIADTASALNDIISEMLVTFRALGVAIILSSQHPTKLDSAASQSVGSKQTFQQVYGPDREELASSMNLKNRDVQDLARFTPGDAFIITQGYFEAQRIRTRDLGKELPLFPPPSDQELRNEICREKWFKEGKTNRISDGLDQLKEHMDMFDDERNTINNEVTKLLKICKSLLGKKGGQLNRLHIATVEQSLRGLKGKLTSSYNKFEKGPLRRFSSLFDELDDQEDDLRAFGESLNKRFETVIKTGEQDLLAVIDRLINNCMKLKYKETNHAKKK